MVDMFEEYTLKARERSSRCVLNNDDPPIVRLENISKSFGKVQANRDICLSIREGRVKALLGENGAGKSTLMSILSGRYAPDKGAIYVDGREQRFHSPKDALEAGIGMVYQHFMLVDNMTVAQNVFLGQRMGFFINPSAMEDSVARLAEEYGLQIDPKASITSLSMGERQRVEILKLLHRKSRVLIFDEPTAVLTPKETFHLFEAIWSMTQMGKSIVFISHKLAEVLSVADEIAILRSGEIVDEFVEKDAPTKEELARKMVGRDVILQVDKAPAKLGDVVLEVRELSGGPLKDVDLVVHQGEVVALAGVAGNGQKPLVETICGLRAPGAGEVNILGKDWKRFYRAANPRKAWKDSLCYIPEDRQGLATCGNLDMVDNVLLTTRHGFSNRFFLSQDRAASTTERLIQEFNVRPPLTKTKARHLSGGNLQKLVLAREFFRQPKIIIAEQPTQGLDIAATEEVWRQLLLARSRAGVLLVTGDLNEAMQLADRIAVMYRGRIMDTLFVDGMDVKELFDRIGLLMAGVRPGE